MPALRKFGHARRVVKLEASAHAPQQREFASRRRPFQNERNLHQAMSKLSVLLSPRGFLAMKIWVLSCCLFLVGFSASASADDTPAITISAATAYADPVESGVRISSAGAKRWNEDDVALVWYRQFASAGQLRVSVVVVPTSSGELGLRLRVGQQQLESKTSVVVGQEITIDIGTIQIEAPGYHSFTLHYSGASSANVARCDVKALQFQGKPVDGSHFNLKERRNAASVHLVYPTPKDVSVSAFYCEMTGVEDPIWTYYMACGWHRGYFGMQVNSPTERRIIFSVWDSGREAVDRDKVQAEDRVQLVANGDGVYSGDFGNEGTGGHSHLKFQWKTGERQRFLVTAEPVDESHTIFAGYYFRPDQQQWMLISSWKAPKEGKRLRGLYSFSENFVGQNGHLLRKALYGNQWIRTSDGTWLELTKATFSHDPTGKEDRRDRFMGVEDGQFFLSHGLVSNEGFEDGFTEFGKPFTRSASAHSPESMELPPLPPIE